MSADSRLPEWVEDWIADSKVEGGENVVWEDVVTVRHLHALLSRFRLCEREAVQYLVSPDNHELPVPLYAEATSPATKEADQNDDSDEDCPPCPGCYSRDCNGECIMSDMDHNN